jgi:outer membrane protein assembly factor BamB
MTVDQLIFIGLRGYVLALERDAGTVVWCNDQLKSGYTTILLDGDRLIVSTNGYIYCLNPLNGEILWSNPLTGYGCGVTHMVSCRAQVDPTILQQAADADAEASSHTTTAAS